MPDGKNQWMPTSQLSDECARAGGSVPAECERAGRLGEKRVHAPDIITKPQVNIAGYL